MSFSIVINLVERNDDFKTRVTNYVKVSCRAKSFY